MQTTTLLALALGAMLGATSLPAAPIVVTWTGTVLNGIDDTSVFGLGTGADLTGRAFTAIFQVDPAGGLLTSSPGFAQIRGGTNFGGGTYASPLLLASLTINGNTYNFSSDYFGGYERDATPGRSTIYTEASQQQLPSGAIEFLFLTEFRADNSIPFTGLGESLAIAVNGRGIFQAYTGAGSRLFAGNLSPTFVTIESLTTPPTGNVPEPGTGVLVVTALSAVLLFKRRYTGSRPNSKDRPNAARS
ncbi:MAG: PEP-CTERM sorting domain-containing protein [Bryobacterales bacterium]|nr:PEP-CTERM sorting domain-containing protein [Bryobacterales bacterium]